MKPGDLVQIKRHVIQQNPQCAYHGIGIVVDNSGHLCAKVMWMGLPKETRRTRTFPKRYLEVINASR